MRPLFNKIIFFLFFTSRTFAQTAPEIDTIKIYKNKSGIRYKVYEKIWFRSDNKYSWFNKKVNRQDSIVIPMFDTSSHYFKVYDHKNRQILEGQKNGKYGWLQGSITFYYKNGNIKRTEFRDFDKMDMRHIYGLKNPTDINNSYVWKYYRKNGSIKTKKEYVIKDMSSRESFSEYNYKAIPQTTKYYRDGKVKSVRLFGHKK